MAESNLNIIEYNRTIKSLNGLTVSTFLEKMASCFIIEEKDNNIKPEQPHHFSMYLDKKWYLLIAKPELIDENDTVGSLDTQIMFKNVIQPVLGIDDQKADNRIGFVDGTLGNEGLQKVVDSNQAKVAFGFYPVSISQLKAVADTNQIMPPKSTYIEPKLRSGLIIYELSNE